MGGFSMNKVLGNLKKRQTFGGSTGSVDETPIDHANDTPDSIAVRCVGDDVVFLPSIVEATVASPAAAAESARLIRKFLQRDYWSKPSCQYNAIMLVRILADNPGPGFTKFMDKKFIDATKELLRSGRDASVRQILMETLDSFETNKSLDEGLAPMIDMWKKEKEKAYKTYGGMSGVPVQPSMMMPPPGFNPYPQHQPQAYYPRPGHSKRLPDPIELTNRLEEARSSAKLLEQVVACTPASEFLSNDLIKEFSDRCTSASRSIQGYMAAENPGPDNDTMESLIDTNEQLQQALNHHRRALLQAKKQLGLGDNRASTSSPAPHLPSPINQPSSVPPVPARKAVGGGGTGGNGKGKAYLDAHDYSSSSAAIAGPSRSASGTPHRHSTDDDDDSQDPFRDPPAESHYTAAAAGGSSSRPGAGSALGGDRGPPRLSFEPFHPGFGGGSSSGPAADKGRAEPVTPVSDDGTDVYRATPKQDGGHVYRY
ncbi:hypothetical protein CHGG_06616 [Chaetomium globosum CBS 148.51]|uniref:GAT domain-containing protein n=1 Tax=Chaetomium globosum (strain ATCC 6205 / CBS 148.51 / DSM 1962 / NBRC 6347 / NRRL 1970) TaxID=306901 RepID=Q2H3Z9_CHAGB|nr:uncharacterized protein CHGG_06616 [Chaetomium globosum CBS 148.51]EAQ89997.1 hypothetical protein CHGG_06616 [Chaetomium globosum CBS 148.51]